MAIPKCHQNCRINPILITILTETLFWVRISQADFKIHKEMKRSRITKIFLRKSKVSELVLPDVKIYYNAMLKQHSTGRKIDKQNRTVSPEIPIYRHFTYRKGGTAKQWRKDILFNKWC